MDVMKSNSELEFAVFDAMKRYFDTDDRRIRHAQNVLTYAKEIMKTEKGDYDIIVPAALLHDIGIHECERKYRSTGGQLQEKEGPPIARKILEDLHVDEKKIEEICRIIASHHSPGEIDTLNFKVIWDADLLVNLNDECDRTDKKRLKGIIAKTFMTETGKTIAEGVYL